ncbi:MAG: hypothetical protein IKP38_05655 [Clostridia bacterium]|nr:hypothetical protein [Clostridia bacterium]
MKKLIHPGFFREIFRQLRGKGLVATFILAGLNLVFFSIYLTRDPVKASIGHFDARLMVAPMLIMLYVFVPVMVFGAYRWLNKRVESDFYHAIPLTRTQIYATTSAAIFLWLSIALGSYAVVHAILRTAFGLPINWLLFLCVFVNMLIAMIEIVAAFSIGLSLCGRGFTAFFQSIAVLFLPRVILTVFWILTEVDSGFTLPFSMILPFFNPEYNIAATPIHSLIYGINYANPLAMLYSLVMSTGLLLLGGVAFRKRKSELAEIPYASKVLQAATRVMFGMPQLLSVTVILNVWLRYGWDEDFMPREILIPLVMTSILFSFIFYCLYELISSRKMKKVVKAMPGYVLCLALSAFFIFVPFWVGKARTLTPISAEKIKSFRISNESTILIPSNISGSETWSDYVLYHHTFSDTKANALIANQSKEDCKNQQKGDEVNITGMERIIVNDGGLFRKMVNLPADYSYSLINFKEAFLKICKNDPAFTEKVAAYPKGQITYYAQGLSLSEAREVGRLFREDYEKLTDEQRMSLIGSYGTVIDVVQSKSPIALSIGLYGSYGTENYTATYRINELTPNAAKAMLGYLNARNAETVKKELKTLVEWMEHPKNDPAFDRFNVGTRYVDQWNLWNYEDQKKFATPKEAHPDEYMLLKALSEAPMTDDPSHCVTFSIVSYEMSSLTSVKTQIAAAGFAVDDTLLAYIELWIASEDSTEEFPFEVLDL